MVVEFNELGVGVAFTKDNIVYFAEEFPIP